MTNHVSTPTAPVTAKQQANALYLQLDQCLEANTYGGSNQVALSRMEFLASDLKWLSSIFSEKVDNLLGWAAILYSPRRHAPWNSPSQTGAEVVAYYMRCDLSSIRTIINRML